jgi:hypothetical protein
LWCLSESIEPTLDTVHRVSEANMDMAAVAAAVNGTMDIGSVLDSIKTDIKLN